MTIDYQYEKNRHDEIIEGLRHYIRIELDKFIEDTLSNALQYRPSSCSKEEVVEAIKSVVKELK